jgi:catechol 2,3-dioxygenase-like lactoylglutathione lyase family enzyme
MKNRNSRLRSHPARTIPVGILTVALAVATVGAALSFARPPKAKEASDTADVLGIAFDGHQVSNLDQSIKYYEAIDFHLSGKPTDWKVDKVVNELGGTKGAESRTAIMTIQSSVSDKPFPFILREYRGIERKNWGNLSSSDLLSGHVDLTLLDSVDATMDKLKSMNMLRTPDIGGGAPSGAPRPAGPRIFAFVQDPDGFFLELFAMRSPVPGQPPAPPKVSNSTATNANIDRVGRQVGFNHIGLNIVDPRKALSFYQDVLGGDYAPYTPPSPSATGGPPRMDMLNGWFSQATTNGKVRLELIAFPQNKGKEPPDEHFADIAVNYVGFQVTDIDAVYSRAKAAGALTVSEGGIVKVKDGRAVMLRDPDVGGFVELFEPTK